jgi:pyruvate/2-oxoglutarate dehydrogenase complex dihydrolipoamide dehydrogenase (E3) component
MTQPQPETFDAIILGSGQAGTPLASELGRAGRRVAIVERAHWGGTCINEGCTPTKRMVACAEVAHQARRAADYGVSTGEVSVDLARIRQLKREIVDSFAASTEKGLKSAPGVECILGEASFSVSHESVQHESVQHESGQHESGPHEVVVTTPGGERVLRAPQIFINTGGHPSRPNIPGLELVPHLLDSASIMELDAVPEHLVVIGGGYIGLEFGQMFSRFGSKVTVLHTGHQLVNQEDPDIAQAVAKFLEDEGLTIHLSVGDLKISTAEDSVAISFQTPDGPRQIQTQHVLIATGRTPNTARLNLQAAGVKTDEHGYIVVNGSLETSAEGIWALGDVKGGPAFTHVSYNDYRRVRDTLLHGKEHTSPPPLTYTMFTDPQLGRIGLSERQAREQGYDVVVATLPMTNVARAIETQRTAGLMKAVVDRKTNLILGAAVLGPEGGEVAAAIQMAMLGGLPYTALRDAEISHPTLAESLNNLFMTLKDVLETAAD